MRVWCGGGGAVSILAMLTLMFMSIFTLILQSAICKETDERTQSIDDGDGRIKRQQQPDPANQFFDNVFQIPISTLNAVNELIKSTRPVIRRARERIQQQYQAWAQQQQNGRPNSRRKPTAGRAEE